MYIQLRNKQPDPGTRSPSITHVQEVTRFLTHASGDVEFTEWSDDEIRLRSGPSESDLKNHRIDLNAGFSRYYEDHVRRVRRANGCHRLHHRDARHLEKDDTMRKSFEATLKWLKDTDFVRRSNGATPPSSSSSSSNPPSSASSDSLSASQPELQQQQQQEQKRCLPPHPPVRLITTSSAIQQLLQLPYENEVRAIRS